MFTFGGDGSARGGLVVGRVLLGGVEVAVGGVEWSFRLWGLRGGARRLVGVCCWVWFSSVVAGG
jgi:hypothetical protein